MGTWGTGSFDNDDAADFIYDVEQRGASVVKTALQKAANANGSLDAWDGAVAVAAAEFVVAGLGHADGLDESAREVFATFEGRENELAALAPEARLAVSRVMAKGSELKELWEEDSVDPDDTQAFLASMERLTLRLG